MHWAMMALAGILLFFSGLVIGLEVNKKELSIREEEIIQLREELFARVRKG